MDDETFSDLVESVGQMKTHLEDRPTPGVVVHQGDDTAPIDPQRDDPAMAN